jgi:hypothetical protein
MFRVTIVALYIGLLMSCSSVQQDVREIRTDWQAQWIGPAAKTVTATDSMLKDVDWIWQVDSHYGMEVKPEVSANPGHCYFRKKWNMPAGVEVVSATLYWAADDSSILYVNGIKTATTTDWETAVSVSIFDNLAAGENVLAVEVINRDTGPNPAGLIGKLIVKFKNRNDMVLQTDASWQATFEKKDGWMKPPFDAKDWASACMLPVQGIQHWQAPGKLSNTWYCFRKSFNLERQPMQASARIAVDSKYWLWINGRLAVFEGGLKRGPTPQDTYYDEVNLVEFLKPGRNTIAVLAWYWGRHGFCHNSSGQAGLLFEADLEQTRLVSDSTWNMTRHPAYGETGAPYPNYRLPEHNIHFDARLDIGDWIQENYDASHWPQAIPFGRPPTQPWGRVWKRPIPLWKDSGLLDYENVGSLPVQATGETIVGRLPHNITITPYLKIKAPAGLLIDLRTDNYKGGSEYNVRAEYVTREGEQEFEGLGYLNGHEVHYTIPKGVEILALKYRETRYNTEFVGSFHCDDEFYNTLWRKARNTMNVNMRDCIQDPDRERSQWWGDEVIVLGEILYACDTHAHSLIKKGIMNLVDWQKPDGVLYSPVPAGKWFHELPCQMLASIGRYGFWNYYLYTGDKATIEYAYPRVRNYLSLWKLGNDGLVVHRPGGWDWEDWGKDIDAPLLDNAWYYMALESARNMAHLVGQQQDVAGYTERMNSLLNNFDARFWNGKEYRSPGYSDATDDRGHGLAALAGLTPATRWKDVRQVLQTEFHASPYTEKYVLESFFKMQDSEGGLARMKARYGNMVASTVTTLWEGWGIGPEGYGGGSYNHGWAGGPLTLLSQYVAGIAPEEPGYVVYHVLPQLGPLHNVEATTETVRGVIRVRIRKDEHSFVIGLSSPPRTTALVGIPIVPGKKIKTISEAGTVLFRNDAPVQGSGKIVFKARTEHYIQFQVAPGEWNFTADYE